MSIAYTVLGQFNGFTAELITKDNGEGYVVLSVNDASMTISVNDWRNLEHALEHTTRSIKGQYRFVET